ncbi:hypothetical protein REPUB_Repub17cG0029100 [Reevesia pubescens]
MPLSIQSSLVSDYLDVKGECDWTKLDFLPSDVLNQLSSLLVDISKDDQVIWGATSNDLFSVSSAYNLIFKPSTSNSILGKDLENGCHPRIKHFLWLVIHDRILTRENCFKSGIVRNTRCPGCDGMCYWKKVSLGLLALVSIAGIFGVSEIKLLLMLVSISQIMLPS